MAHPLIVGGTRVKTRETAPVLDKYTGKVIAEVSVAAREHVDDAAAAAEETFIAGALPVHERAAILDRAAELIAERSKKLGETFTAETGFTIREAELDIQRTVQTMRASAEETRRLAGEMVPFAGAPGQEHRLGFTLRVPIGPVCAITPFNSPLNTVTHKVAPAIGAGNPVVLKPSQMTPLSAFSLCEILEESGLPPGWLSLLFGSGSVIGDWLLEEQRFRFYAFTGSTAVGERLQAGLRLRRSQMELGAVSTTILCEDADVEPALAKIAPASFRKAGQVCTSVQILLVHRDLKEQVEDRLPELAASMQAGDPREPATSVGPMISEGEARRAESWVQEALADGAEALTEVRRDGPLLAPVVLTGVRQGMKVIDQEIFAPVVSILEVDDLDRAIDFVNQMPFGLTTGVFTRDLNRAIGAAQRLRVGVVQIGESSSSRVDIMPYGGTKASGFGKEGPRYAIEEMTEERLVVLNQ
jgi:succinate-semialdehyde dehydrogenase/glutarate-semialdehyde dehydrogenase